MSRQRSYTAQMLDELNNDCRQFITFIENKTGKSIEDHDAQLAKSYDEALENGYVNALFKVRNKLFETKINLSSKRIK